MTQTMADITESNEQFQRLAKLSGIPIVTFRSHRLYNLLPHKANEKAHRAAIEYVAEPKGVPIRQHHFITFGGDTGRGKSRLALGIAWHWLEYEMGGVRYWQVEGLLDTMRGEFDNPPIDRHGLHMMGQLESARKVSLLVLDDLGAEKSTEWAGAKLDELIDYRYIHELPTVFTTNLLFSQLAPRIASRLQEGVTVLLEGPDYRKIKARGRQDER